MILSVNIAETEILQKVNYFVLERVYSSRFNFDEFMLTPTDFDKAKVRIKMKKNSYFIELYLQNLEEFIKNPKVVYQKELNVYDNGELECEGKLQNNYGLVNCISIFNSQIEWDNHNKEKLRSYIANNLKSDRWLIEKMNFSLRPSRIYIGLVFYFYEQPKIPDIIKRLTKAVKEFLDIYFKIFFYNSNLLYKDEKIEYNLSKL